MRNYQKNITITKEQQEYVKSNPKGMNINQLSKMLGLTYNVLYKNMELMGMVKKRPTKVIQMPDYFNLDEFAQYYKH